jgi:hypothetical protein
MLAADMPDTLLGSGSEFDAAKILLGKWLRESFRTARALCRDDFKVYAEERSFIAGWRIAVEHGGRRLVFDVLLDREFPFSPIRVAYKSEDKYLQWPHVEEGGLLCLEAPFPPTLGIVEAAVEALQAACALIDQCQDVAFVKSELQREFLSYWNRSPHAEKKVRSLLNPTNHSARPIAIWYGKDNSIVGETADQVRYWLTNRGFTEEPVILTALYGHLSEPPTPPFPDSPGPLCTLLQARCPDVVTLLQAQALERDITLILGATTPNGEGLLAFGLDRPNLNGFRKGNGLSARAKLLLWKARSKLQRKVVQRFDAAWVHGRALTPGLTQLQAAHVVSIGCGSLGSQVAVRLAQTGVGRLTLIDPEYLEPANVGRHALGINSVGHSKAKALCAHLLQRFPHLNVDAVHGDWQELLDKDPNALASASLIVACIGEWSEDGPLGAWHANSSTQAPILFGWLDELGTASHAVALTNAGPSLSCVLGPDGRLRVAETVWEGVGKRQSEPACGTYFQPFGPIDVAHAENLVSRLSIDILTGYASMPTHRVYAGPTAQITAAGGKWSDDHLKHRPAGYAGPFEYERQVAYCLSCATCERKTAL